MKKWMKQNWWKLIIALVVVGGILWYKRPVEDTSTTLVTPQNRTITQVLKVSGRVDASEKARMTFAGASKLTWLNIKEGDTVKKWQGLASVDSRQLQNQLQIAQNTHGKQFRTFENTLDGVDYYSASGLTDTERRTAESSQLDIRNTALTVESADIALKLAYMSSPISGVVTRIDQKNVGAVMLPTDMIEIVNPSSIFFSAVIDEEDVDKLASAISAEVRLDAFEEQLFPSEITRVSFTPTQSESGGTGYAIWLSLPVDNSAMRYKLGMNGDADIVLKREENILSIPVDALVERDGSTYVEVMRDGVAVKQTITIGISDDEFVAVTDGLSPDDQVIVPTE